MVFSLLATQGMDARGPAGRPVSHDAMGGESDALPGMRRGSAGLGAPSLCSPSPSAHRGAKDETGEEEKWRQARRNWLSATVALWGPPAGWALPDAASSHARAPSHPRQATDNHLDPARSRSRHLHPPASAPSIHRVPCVSRDEPLLARGRAFPRRRSLSPHAPPSPGSPEGPPSAPPP